MEALFVIGFFFLVLNAIYWFIASCIYSIFGDNWGDVILAAPLVIGLLWIIGWIIG